MRPAYRNFHRAQAVMPRQVQKLRIKAEAFDALLLEDHAAAFPPEGFEAALCIYKRQAEYGAHNKIENDAGRLPENGLTHGNQAAVQRPRADSHIVIREGRKEFVRLVDRRGQVRVGKQHHASARLQHPMPNAVALSAVFLVGHYARSEEHTSELQSRQYLVCRLLLEKKKKTYGS